MTNFAYLRVSTNQQDLQNQKFGILDYCNKNQIGNIKFIEDKTSGKISWQERTIGKIIESAKAGDVILASEVSRLGRSTLQFQTDRVFSINSLSLAKTQKAI